MLYRLGDRMMLDSKFLALEDQALKTALFLGQELDQPLEGQQAERAAIRLGALQ